MSTHFAEVRIMKPMIWQPEPHDQRVNQYLAQINHAPYASIAAISFTLFGLFVAAILIGSF
jgi:hypothetical protein